MKRRLSVKTEVEIVVVENTIEEAKFALKFNKKDIKEVKEILDTMNIKHDINKETIVLTNQKDLDGLKEVLDDEKIISSILEGTEYERSISEDDIEIVDEDTLDETDVSDYDVNRDGKIDINDVIYLCDGLSEKMLSEIIDLLSHYISDDDIQVKDDNLQDGDYYELGEGLVRKKVVRNGKKMIIKKSNKMGYKVNKDGKEVRMNPKEVRNRMIAAKKGARKRKGKQAGADRKRKRSLAKKD